MNEAKVENASEVLRALAHPLRLKILDFIDRAKQTHVNKIYSELGLEQSITSQHLRILRMANLVKTEREGKKIHYSIQYDNLIKINAAIRKFLSHPHNQ